MAYLQVRSLASIAYAWRSQTLQARSFQLPLRTVLVFWFALLERTTVLGQEASGTLTFMGKTSRYGRSMVSSEKAFGANQVGWILEFLIL